MTKIPHNDEAEVERRLIEVLGEGRNQWNYRPDLKSEEDLWKNLRQKITQNNLSEIGEHPISDNRLWTNSPYSSSLRRVCPQSENSYILLECNYFLRGENPMSGFGVSGLIILGVILIVII